ncbi:hypothetical protein [Halosimplex halobium]|uniref:hypothetical protein n=1 Tax=Halosimplex halobium TaxID=3396618 RepID=UPI003F56406B
MKSVLNYVLQLTRFELFESSAEVSNPSPKSQIVRNPLTDAGEIANFDGVVLQSGCSYIERFISISRSWEAGCWSGKGGTVEA